MTKVSQEDIDILTAILNEEIAITKRLVEIQTIKSFYQDELDQLRETMHTTRDGTLMFVSQMTEEHLINTVQCMMDPAYGFKRVPKKYLNEVKKRWLINKLMNTTQMIEQSSVGRNALNVIDNEDGAPQY